MSKVLPLTSLLLGLAILTATVAYAACSDPTGVAGEIIYNSDFRTMQYCDDTSWVTTEGFGFFCAQGDGIVMTSNGWDCSPGGPP